MYNKNSDKSRRAKLITCMCVIIAIILSAGAFVGYRLIRHEKKQSAEIQSLLASISKLSAEMKATSMNDVEWLDNGFNYLAIGNSIALSGGLWNRGMAASDIEHDYFHIVSSYIKARNDEFMGLVHNFSVWERYGYRDETLPYLDHYLSPKLDLITIQLAENAVDLTTYEEDYESLINYIKGKAPKARILVIGDFWTRDNRNDLKIKAVNATGVEFISLEGIADNNDYYCGMGTVIFRKDGKKHIVEHRGVAIHPGDKGMQAIANRIILALQQHFN